MRLHSYSTIYNVGHRAAKDMWPREVVVQEKIDGSQFSFGAFLPEGGGAPELCMRSKGQEVYASTEDKNFKAAVDTVVALFAADKLLPGYVYRGEVLSKPRGNVLAYDRAPRGNVILFDVDRGEEAYVDGTGADEAETLADHGLLLGLEVVPELYRGRLDSLGQLNALLETTSCLGGQKIEGVVIKAYGFYGPDKKTLMCKHVSEKFKEQHDKDFKARNPNHGDVLIEIGDRYTTEARFRKAVQHLRDDGKLDESPRDIGALIHEVQVDIDRECADEIKEALYKWALPKVRRLFVRGLPEWYKQELAKAAFEDRSGDAHPGTTIPTELSEDAVNALDEDLSGSESQALADATGAP